MSAFRSSRYTLLSLVFAATVAMLPNSVLFPASHDIAVHLHQPDTFVGWMVTTYAISYVLSTPLLGILSDYLGRRGVLVTGLLVFALGGLVPVFTTDVTMILIGRVILGIGSAGIMPMVDSLVGDTYPQGVLRRQALAGFAAALAVAEAVAPFLGGLADAWHWQAVFLLYGLAVFAALFCMMITVPPRVLVKDENVTFSAYIKSIRIALAIPHLLASILGAMCYGIVYFGVCSLLPYVIGTGYSGLWAGVLFLPIGFSWLATTVWLSRKSHLQNIRALVVGSTLILSFLTLLLAGIHQYLLVLLIGCGWGLGSGLLTTLFSWIVGDESPERVRGAMNGVFNAAYVLGFSIGAPLFIWLKQQWALFSALSVGAIVLFVLAIYLFWMMRQSVKAETARRDSQLFEDML